MGQKRRVEWEHHQTESREPERRCKLNLLESTLRLVDGIDYWGWKTCVRDQEVFLSRIRKTEIDAKNRATLKEQLSTLSVHILKLREPEWLQNQGELLSTFGKMERLSTWVPSTSNKKKLCGVLQSAKEQLDHLRDHAG